jgi:hypothetical protein
MRKDVSGPLYKDNDPHKTVTPFKKPVDRKNIPPKKNEGSKKMGSVKSIRG